MKVLPKFPIVHTSFNMRDGAQFLAIATITFLLAACGGGGGNVGGGVTAPGNPNPPPDHGYTGPMDPYTGRPAAGTLTRNITGTVISGPTADAQVAAYLLNPDGSNGAAIGSATADQHGNFAMKLTQIPTGMIRLVATGGTFTSEADASTQKNQRLELVAPYVTTALHYFVITPLTHYASQRLTYLASRQGRSLTDTYTTASSSACGVVTGNDAIAASDPTHSGVDYLSIVPGSPQDMLNAYSDALTALEYYGVEYDLPSHTVVRLLVQSHLTGFPSYTDVDGHLINVGKWVKESFDETQPFTLRQMGMALPAPSVFVIVLAMNAVPACASGDHTGFYQRFPLPPGGSDYLDDDTCATYIHKMDAIKAKVSTNNRSKFVS